jgi:hypothetical protein
MKMPGFSELIEDCLRRLGLGDNLPDVLADFPEYQGQLKPILLVALTSRVFSSPAPDPASQLLGKNKMLAEMELLRHDGDYLE